MFLIELSIDGLSYLKKALKTVVVTGENALLHSEIAKHLEQPIIGDKLVADIQAKALQGGAPAPAAPAPVMTPAPMPTAAPMPVVVPLPAAPVAALPALNAMGATPQVPAELLP